MATMGSWSSDFKWASYLWQFSQEAQHGLTLQVPPPPPAPLPPSGLQGASTDKLTANVSFPLKGLRLHQVASPECTAAGPADCCYDLFAVSNHYGTLTGGWGR